MFPDSIDMTGQAAVALTTQYMQRCSTFSRARLAARLSWVKGRKICERGGYGGAQHAADHHHAAFSLFPVGRRNNSLDEMQLGKMSSEMSSDGSFISVSVG